MNMLWVVGFFAVIGVIQLVNSELAKERAKKDPNSWYYKKPDRNNYSGRRDFDDDIDSWDDNDPRFG
jgi:hypothetical protein